MSPASKPPLPLAAALGLLLTLRGLALLALVVGRRWRGSRVSALDERERLADQGIRIDKFDVDLMDHSDRRQQSLDEQTRQQEARQSAAPRNASRRVVSTEVTPTSNPRNRASGQGGLNVVI